MVNPYEVSPNREPAGFRRQRLGNVFISLVGGLGTAVFASIDGFVVSGSYRSSMVCFFLCALTSIPLLVCSIMFRNEAKVRQQIVRVGLLLFYILSLFFYLLFLSKGSRPNLSNSSQVHIYLLPILLLVPSFFLSIVSGWIANTIEPKTSESRNCRSPYR